jgi:hypothetical protein
MVTALELRQGTDLSSWAESYHQVIDTFLASIPALPVRRLGTIPGFSEFLRLRSAAADPGKPGSLVPTVSVR